MKRYSKVGNREGRPAYRTPAWRQNRPPRLKGKVQRAGIKSIRKPKKK